MFKQTYLKFQNREIIRANHQALEMKIYILIILLAILALASLRVAAPYFLEWYLNRAFEPAMKEGGGLHQLADVLEASVGSIMAPRDVRSQPRDAVGEGAMHYYQKNPQALQRDKKYFETWLSASTIADASRQREPQPGRWESSAALAWVAPSQRTDAWGHAFCIQSDQQRTIVLSPGPQALSSLDCSILKVPKEDLTRMPKGLLITLSSGALILFVNR